MSRSRNSDGDVGVGGIYALSIFGYYNVNSA